MCVRGDQAVLNGKIGIHCVAVYTLDYITVDICLEIKSGFYSHLSTCLKQRVADI